MKAVLFFLSLVVSASTVFGAVNAVGYLNLAVQPGFNLVAPQLQSDDQRISKLFDTVPPGTIIYRLEGAEFTVITRVSGGGFMPAAAAEEPLPVGEGVIVYNPGNQPFIITFVGEVLQGTLINPLPAGLSIQASMVPQAATLDELGFEPVHGDQVYFLDESGSYEAYLYVETETGRWLPTSPRPLQVGEAFFLRTSVARDWVRTFFLNPPAEGGD